MYLKFILIVEDSWKVTQVIRVLARLMFVWSEEGNLLGLQPSTISLRNYLFCGFFNHLLLFECIHISK